MSSLQNKNNESERAAKLSAENAKNLERLREQAIANQAEFVLTELDTAITFCEVALSTDDPTRRARNIQNAFTGYQTALHFSNAIEQNLRNDKSFQEKLRILESRLQELGQKP